MLTVPVAKEIIASMEAEASREKTPLKMFEKLFRGNFALRNLGAKNIC